MFRYKEVQNSISSSKFLTVQTRAVEDYAVQNPEPETYDLLLDFCKIATQLRAPDFSWPRSRTAAGCRGPGRRPRPGRPVPPACYDRDQQLGVAQKLTVSLGRRTEV